MEFGKYLKQLRIEQSLTQKELTTRINLIGKEFLGIDSVSISRWERGITKPNVARSIKVLRCLTNDLLPYLLSLPIDLKKNDLENVEAKRFHNPDAILAAATYNKIINNISFEIQPLFNKLESYNTAEKISNFLNNLNEKEIQNNIDWYDYQTKNKIFSKKIIINDHSEMQGHLLSFFFDHKKISDYYTSPYLAIPKNDAISYKDNKPMALFTATRYAKTDQGYWVINALLAYFIATHANVISLYFYLFDNVAVEYFEKINAKKIAYNTLDSHGKVKLGGKAYRFGVYYLDSADFLARPEIINLLQEVNYSPRFSLKTDQNQTVADLLSDCVIIKKIK
ncbi:helix-turn-helix domain-containing protein [Vibrio cyclitrophicus]